METHDLALRLGLALALGFVVGLERGWKERDEEEGGRTAGLRTFSLIGLMGGLFGALSLGGDRLFLSAGFIVLGATLAVFMWREGERDNDLSATSLVAALLTFVLGAFAVMGDMAVAAGAGVVAVALLAWKSALHGWMERITWRELRSGLLLAAMTFIALPLLPRRAIDPWGAVNPHALWLMTILIAAVSFAGYAAMKLAGPRRGLIVAATLGGLFASTAVTIALARLARDNAVHVRLLVGGILAASCVMALRVLVVTGLFDMELAATLAPTLGMAAVVTAILAFALVRQASPTGTQPSELVYRNPFELGEALRFGAILAIVAIAVVVGRRAFGDAGLLGVAALSGLADVDAITLSAAALAGASAVAGDAILLAVAVNTVAKSAYGWYAGGARIGLPLLAANAVVITVALGARLLLD